MIYYNCILFEIEKSFYARLEKTPYQSTSSCHKHLYEDDRLMAMSNIIASAKIVYIQHFRFSF